MRRGLLKLLMMPVATALTVVLCLPSSAASHTDTGSSLASLVAAALRHAPLPAAGVAVATPARVSGSQATLGSGENALTMVALDQRNSVVERTAGGVREMTVLRRGNTAKFRLNLAVGTTLRRAGAGGFAVVTLAGALLGVITAPWAVDATGRELPTRYTTSGDIIVQHVNTRGAVYPIVADPYVRFYWTGAVITLDPADMNDVAEVGMEAALSPWLDAWELGDVVALALGGLAAYASWEVSQARCFWFWEPWTAIWGGWGVRWGTYAC